MLGFPEEKIAQIEIAIRKMSPEEAARYVGMKLFEIREMKVKEENNPSHDCHSYETKIAESEEELIRYLNKGGDLLKELSNGRFIVRRTRTD